MLNIYVLAQACTGILAPIHFPEIINVNLIYEFKVIIDFQLHAFFIFLSAIFQRQKISIEE
jgi:hypothetical protein